MVIRDKTFHEDCVKSQARTTSTQQTGFAGTGAALYNEIRASLPLADKVTIPKSYEDKNGHMNIRQAFILYILMYIDTICQFLMTQDGKPCKVLELMIVLCKRDMEFLM